jgi:hypothetical protein
MCIRTCSEDLFLLESNGISEGVMLSQKKEAWMLGYQEGFSNGYDEGYEKGLQEGVEKERRFKQLWLDFIKVKCVCGCITPYPIFRTTLSTEFRMPEKELRCCQSCGDNIQDSAVIKAYLNYTSSH